MPEFYAGGHGRQNVCGGADGCGAVVQAGAASRMHARWHQDLGDWLGRIGAQLAALGGPEALAAQAAATALYAQIMDREDPVKIPGGPSLPSGITGSPGASGG